MSIIAAVDPLVHSSRVTRLLAPGTDGVMHDSGTRRFDRYARRSIGAVAAAVTWSANVMPVSLSTPNHPTGRMAESSDVIA